MSTQATMIVAGVALVLSGLVLSLLWRDAGVLLACNGVLLIAAALTGHLIPQELWP